jgi:hypothetical protein
VTVSAVIVVHIDGVTNISEPRGEKARDKVPCRFADQSQPGSTGVWCAGDVQRAQSSTLIWMLSGDVVASALAEIADLPVLVVQRPLSLNALLEGYL